MHDSDLGDNMRIRYYSRCLNPAGELVETNKCDGLKVGQTVEFEVALELLSCPSDPSKWHQSFTIYPVGVGENLTVEVDLLCDCPCNNDPTHPVSATHNFFRLFLGLLKERTSKEKQRNYFVLWKFPIALKKYQLWFKLSLENRGNLKLYQILFAFSLLYVERFSAV